jgi:adenosylmethionine-8-amino-7-oxononanoate aminotransferase
MKQHLDALLAKHPSVKQARCVGLFGCFDLARRIRAASQQRLRQ